MTQCVLCESSHLTRINQITFGVWKDEQVIDECKKSENENNKLLIRDTKDYDLVECNDCQHVQVSANYHQALFEKLYFHSDQEEVMWHESLQGNYQAYQDMVDFTQEYLPESAYIADFGCGTGSLLSAFKEHYQQSSVQQQQAKLFGVDFNPRCTLDYVEYISADLNDVSQFNKCKRAQGFDIACASHTLEHVSDPVMFLRGISETLSLNGKIFIEVPDFSFALHPQLAGQSNLVNLQHIQYFTLKTLAFCAQRAGLQLIKYKQVTTGYIPRLMVILAQSDSIEEHAQANIHHRLIESSQASAAFAIDTICRITAEKRCALSAYIESLINNNNKVGLWGIGADFYLMLRDIPEFSEILKSELIELFDYEHAGKHIEGKTILPSKSIPAFNGEVVLLPVLAETRVKMRALSMHWPVIVSDHYQQDMLAVEGMHEQACQVCQNKDWLPIDTLSSGIWQKNEKCLSRDEIEFPIGECRVCKHTQIYRPYSAAIFKKLYFSSDQQPEMWHTPAGQASPYFEMLALFSEKLASANTVADFGCGEGLLMREIKLAKPDVNVVGFDFNIQGKEQGITRVSCDLNNQTQIMKAHNGVKFDLLTSSHVLEHVINPVMFLQALKTRLNKHGLLFIEVPDSSACHQHLKLHSTNLVHGQHIHYYTQDSLIHIALRAGFQLIKQRQFVTGDIPRLQMLFSVIPSEELARIKFIPRIQQSASTTVRARFTQYQAQLSLITKRIKALLASEDKIGLWGIGGDFYQLSKACPNLLRDIRAQKIILFDYSLKGLTFQEQVINDSADIEKVEFPVLITPMYLPTRAKMLELASNWPSNVIDPYRRH